MIFVFVSVTQKGGVNLSKSVCDEVRGTEYSR